MMKQILTLALICTLAFGLFEHQAGVRDWHIKTVGQIQEAQIESKNIFFQSKENLFGQLKTQTGDVEVSLGRNQDGLKNRFLWNKNRQTQNHKQFSLTYNQESLQVYNFARNSFQEISNSQLEPESDLVDYLYVQKNQVLFLTEQTVYSSQSERNLSLQQDNKQNKRQQQQQTEDDLFLKEFVTTNNNDKFVALAQNENNIYIVGHSESDNLCIFQFSNTSLISLQETTSTQLSKQCAKISYPFQQENLQISSSFVFYKNGQDSILFDLQSAKQVNLQNLTGELSASISQNYIVEVLNGKTYNFYQIRSGSLEKQHNFENSKKSQISIINLDDSTEKDSVYFIENDKKGFASLQQLQNSSKTEIYSWVQQGSILNAWVRVFNTQAYILVQNEDLQTNLYTSKQKERLWSREESLAYISDLKFVDYTHEKERHVSSYHELLDEKGKFNTLYIVPQFVLRVTDEFQEIVQSIFGLLKYMQNLFQGVLKIRNAEDFKALNDIGADDTDEYNIFYGLKKFLLLFTEQKTLFRFESDTGKLVWRSNLSDQVEPSYKIYGVYDLEEREGETIHNEVIAIYHSEQENRVKILQINPSNGDLKLVKNFECTQILKVMKIQKEFNQHVLILDQNYKGYSYPQFSSDLLHDMSQDIIFYSFNKENNLLEGYRFFNNQVEQVWNLKFSDHEVVIQIDSSYSEDASPRIGIFDDKKVIFKHIDYTNFAVITKNKGKSVYKGDGILNLYIVNSKTGRILLNHNQQLVDLSLPINMVYDENAVFVSYFNPEQFMYEIWVVEAYTKDIITNVYSIVDQYYLNPKGEEKFNYVDQNLDIVFLEQKYGFPKGIKSFSVVSTRLSLTKRNLAIITQQNQVYSLDRHLVSPRRAIKDKLGSDLPKIISFDSADLPPYEYLLPVNFVNTLTYYLNLNGLKNVQFAPTQFESTSLFVAYGGDIFVGKVAPEKTFDILSEDFNYVSLIATSVLVVFLAIFMRKFAKKSLIFKLFHK